MEEIQKSYFAVIPANVRYDKELTPNAKLLYGEITALCNEKGYCWASNDYFAKLYNVSQTSITNWINQLIKKEYIYREIKYKNNTKEIQNRYLKLTDDPIQNILRGYPKNFGEGTQKILRDNNTYNNTYNIYTQKKNRLSNQREYTETELKNLYNNIGG